jgi:hypothetical protein
MSNNINISSGSKSFQNKIFGSVVKLTKPSFAYHGKIFSDTTFNNQKIISILEDNTYYFNHGISDELVVYDEFSISFSGDSDIQSFIDFYIQNSPTMNPAEARALLSGAFANTNSSFGLDSSQNSEDNPYEDNTPPECPI